jgi:hypothetical protein
MKPFLRNPGARFAGCGASATTFAALAVVLAAAIVTLIAPLLVATAAHAGTFSASLESGAVWFSRNDVRAPGDAGDEFDLMELTGTGPDWYRRVTLNYTINERHSLRLLYAPLEVDGTGTLSQATRFRGETFEPGIETRGTYKFNTYRLTYRYTFHPWAFWQWAVGGAILVRDADITLEQGDLKETESNVGPVPLLHLYGVRRLTARLAAVFDVEGLGAPQGRAIDAAFSLSYEPTRNWSLSAGYRTLEGGADVDKVYTFAWLHYLLLSVTYRPGQL